DGARVIRKSISRQDNREYGFVRWHSQMKRLQRFNELVPGLFPKLLDVGVDGDAAYFEIEYFDDAYDVKQYLTEENPSFASIHRLHNQFWDALDLLHSHRLYAPWGSMRLYFEEEIVKKLTDALKNSEFSEFAQQNSFLFEEEMVPGLLGEIEWCRERFGSVRISTECLTHGNITLENVMYIPDTGRIIFIDPYDENIVDCVENEYSQILQCSKNHYGFINDRTVDVEGNSVRFNCQIPAGLQQFDRLFRSRLRNYLNREKLFIVSLFEISQFVRMLPFKILSGELNKAKYFYVLASSLVHKLQQS
ncbi:hypothetical protein N9F34_04545, partial [Alphaproteobacteria bacterium]|nr:hypothetical protein [Alphaproteobacteria bacterium]